MALVHYVQPALIRYSMDPVGRVILAQQALTRPKEPPLARLILSVHTLGTEETGPALHIQQALTPTRELLPARHAQPGRSGPLVFQVFGKLFGIQSLYTNQYLTADPYGYPKAQRRFQI